MKLETAVGTVYNGNEERKAQTSTRICASKKEPGGERMPVSSRHAETKIKRLDPLPIRLFQKKLQLRLEVTVRVLVVLNRGGGELGGLVVDHALLQGPTRACGLDHKLDFALVLERRKEVDGFVDRLSARQKSVVLEDAGLELGSAKSYEIEISIERVWKRRVQRRTRVPLRCSHPPPWQGQYHRSPNRRERNQVRGSDLLDGEMNGPGRLQDCRKRGKRPEPIGWKSKGQLKGKDRLEAEGRTDHDVDRLAEDLSSEEREVSRRKENAERWIAGRTLHALP